MRREVLSRREQDWEISAIARRFEEKGWFDAFDVLNKRRQYNAISRFVHATEGRRMKQGTVNPYAVPRFKLTPPMLAEAWRWLEAGHEKDELPRRLKRLGLLEPQEAHYCWLALQRFDLASLGELADAQEMFDRLVGKGRTQGFRVSPEERRAIELHAIKAAERHFEARGYKVVNVSAKQPYDLVCTKGRKELLVEVKGTTGNGSAVLLTAGEVKNAKRAVPMALFVLAHIKLVKKGKAVSCTRGTAKVLHPWRISDDGTLSPVGYSYLVGKADR
jgi:hypothetical protein